MAQWLPLLTSQSDVDATLESMQQAGVKVLRTWVKPQIVTFGEGYTDEPKGFNAINGSELQSALETNLTYYQVCAL